MKVCGLITEYNPFHEGHKIHIRKALELSKADCLIAIMSGSFVQRGEPAIIDKFLRAKTAVENGVDLVLELPAIYATANAGDFCKGAVSILNSLNIVKDICFGSKFTCPDPLFSIAKLLIKEENEFKTLLKINIKKGFNYPSAREKAIRFFLPDLPADSLNDANTVLGIEYIKAILELRSEIKPHTYIREKGYQASDIRKKLTDSLFEIEKNRSSFQSVKTKDFISADDLTPMLKYRLLSSDFENIYGVNRTLYNKIKTNLYNFDRFEMLTKQLKTKDITKTHIKRALIHVLLNISSDDMSLLSQNTPSYVRILSCSEKGKELISKTAKYKTIITNPSQAHLIKDEPSRRCFEIDMLSSEIYNSLRAVKYSHMQNEYKVNIF